MQRECPRFKPEGSGFCRLSESNPRNAKCTTEKANYAVQECDLLICIGARFDDRVTGASPPLLPCQGVHLDIDPAEVGKRRQPDAPVVSPNGAEGLDGFQKSNRGSTTVWSSRPSMHGLSSPDWTWHPVARDLGRLRSLKPTYRDVGQHQMWVAQHYPSAAQIPSTSAGLGAMGYGLPAAIGVQLAHPDARVINVTGDGSIMMNVQELATIKRYNLPIKVVVLDNQCLGMVRQWQDLFLGKRHSEVDLSDNPDFVQLAEAFGFESFRVTRPIK